MRFGLWLPVAFVLLCVFGFTGQGQENNWKIRFGKENAGFIKSLQNEGRQMDLPKSLPFFSVLIDSIPNILGDQWNSTVKNDTLFFAFSDSLRGWAAEDRSFIHGTKITLRFINTGKQNHRVENLVPLGESRDKVYITAAGSKDWPQYLCRSRLYLPGQGPIGVVLPDNVWHLGFATLPVNDSLSLTALARRGNRDKERTEIDRWSVTLKPGGWAEYSWYAEVHRGGWHEALKRVFQERWVYDLESFNDSLFRRKDLGWMKNSYLMLLQFAWDKKYFDYRTQTRTFYNDLFEYDSLTGGYDIFTLWPTWPRLGLDQRNQWDMYRDLPGGLTELNKQSEFCHYKKKKFFISYNPWDEGTRKEDQMKGLEELLRATNADGVVLDTRGASSRELQAAADHVKPGIIMYSEGMAIPKDMPGIVSGRVHDALVLPPPLNLNKLIKPDFAIFRVLQLADDRLHRELAIAFFNGYGVEINTMRPGRPDWMKEEFAYLGRTTRILRENSAVFHNDRFYPLVPSLVDSIWVNRWEAPGKVIYTLYSANPRGCQGPLLDAADVKPGNHVVDLWNYKEIIPEKHRGKKVISARVDPFDRAWLNSRREGNCGCIGIFPELIQAEMKDNILALHTPPGIIVLSAGSPSYGRESVTLPGGNHTMALLDYFPDTLSRLVIQLFDSTELIDERILLFDRKQGSPATASLPLVHVGKATGTPGKISEPFATPVAKTLPAGMAEVPAGMFRFYTKRDPSTLDPFIAFPDFHDTVTINMPRFCMDVTPVTNDDYRNFIQSGNYHPTDTSAFLRHWKGGAPLPGTETQPVVFVNLEDADAYCKWAGKRLPTEQEWQYAAQGTDMRKYPWGNGMDSTRCNYNLNRPTDVRQFAGGASPFGILDMVGNVWQMTSDVYDNGSYYFTILRGGSYYHPKESIWYVTGGPLPADHPEMLLLLSPGLNRNATVGFRCVKDMN